MTPTPEQKALLQQARSAALLKRWAAGRSLSQAELAEIQHLLPSGENGTPSTPGPGPSAAPTGDAGGTFSLAPGQPIPRRVVWARNLSEYAADLGVSAQTLKYWIRIGKSKGQLPPLDTRWKLADWWTLCMKQRVPDHVLEFAKERPAEAAPPAATPPQGEPPASAAPAAALGMNLAEFDGKVGDGLAQARTLLKANYEALQQAYASGTEAQIEQRERRWQKSLEAVRRAEKEERAAREQSGELIDRGDLIADLLTFLEVLRTMRLGMPARVLRRLGDVDPELAQRIAAAIDAERLGEDSVLRQLSVLRTPADAELQLAAA